HPGLFLPFPDPFNEGLASQVETMLAFGGQLTLDDHLGRDTRMIGARLPQRRESAPAMPGCERVHERVLESMAHVQRAGDIRRRQHDAVRLAVTAWCESSGSFPTVVDPALDVAGSVGLVHEGPGLYG